MNYTFASDLTQTSNYYAFTSAPEEESKEVSDYGEWIKNNWENIDEIYGNFRDDYALDADAAIEKIANEHAIFAGMKLAVSKINKTADKYNCTVRIKAASQTSAIDVNVTLKEYKEELKGDLLVGDQNKGTIYISLGSTFDSRILQLHLNQLFDDASYFSLGSIPIKMKSGEPTFMLCVGLNFTTSSYDPNFN